MRIAEFRRPRSAPDFLDRAAPPLAVARQAVDFMEAWTSEVFTLSMVFDRRRRRAERAIDRVKASEKRSFHEVDGALCRAGASEAAPAPRPPREIAADNVFAIIAVRAILNRGRVRRHFAGPPVAAEATQNSRKRDSGSTDRQPLGFPRNGQGKKFGNPWKSLEKLGISLEFLWKSLEILGKAWRCGDRRSAPQ